MVVSLERIEKELPKVDVHAHLSGSISQTYLEEKSQGNWAAVDVVTPRSLSKCFEYFNAVARIIVDLESLEAATRHVLKTFAAEACMYLELRTTPKALGGACELEYVAIIERVASELADLIEVKLLLSLDRGAVESIHDAVRRFEALIDLARAFPQFVVGLDICGDPRCKTLEQFVLPALKLVAPVGMPITVHTGEIADDKEVRAILRDATQLGIKRLGHCCFIPDDVHIPADIGVEMCPTSNLVAMQLPDLSTHSYGSYRRRCLISINTDDRGLFNCSLSSELADLAQAFNLDWCELVRLQREALRSSFHPNYNELLARFDARLADLEPANRPLSNRIS